VGGIELLVFVPFNSFLYAVDLLGYSFMSMATLFVAFAFRGGGVERIARGSGCCMDPPGGTQDQLGVRGTS
jgi:hypothetical protein